MEVTNEQNTDTPLLTNGDLAIAAYAISQCFNAYLESYEREDYEEMTKEQMESSMNALQTSFAKFDALVRVLQENGQDASDLDQETAEDTDEGQD
jgi:hypothetical protein